MNNVDTPEFEQDPRDKSPIYLQLARFIEKAISDGRYLPDQALPSERVLAE